MTDKSILCGEKEICEWLKVTPKQLRALRGQGLPVVRIAGHVWTEARILEEWFREQLTLREADHAPDPK